MPKIIIVGDSTVSSFNDYTYYYPRYGYGTQLNRYFNLEVINLALSGRSSKSFINESNYKKFLDSINEGDFVFVGFGHNDEKDDDKARFSSALKPLDEEGSFKYYLYNYYLKPAISKGATPIICTPIVRLNLNHKYEGNDIHITANGDYRKCILELGKEENIFTIDLTTKTKELFEKISLEETIIHHAITKGKKVNNIVTYDERSVDKAHLSYLGANYVAYMIKEEILNSNISLKNYINNDISKPTNDILKVNESYVYKDYETPDLDNYKPIDRFVTNSKDYYGTAFGDLTINFNDDLSGYYAYGDGSEFIVGQDSESECGKINASQEGFAYLFRRFDKAYNFKFSCDVKVIKEKHLRQSGFGIMLRNDCYLNQSTPLVTYNTNYIASGLLTTDAQTYLIFSRDNPTDLKKGDNILPYFYKKDDELKLSIERLGQVIKCKIIYEGKEYYKEFIDFDILSLDKYLFVGVFATKGTLIKCSNLKFELLNIALNA